jgi:hypothetical protein
MTAAWPKDEVATADELATLTAFLGHQREFLIRKTSGLNEEQMRTAACPPSDLTLLGLVRHASEVERHWAKKVLRGFRYWVYLLRIRPSRRRQGW